MDFTGERVVPGQVDADLWQEHVSRYEFARHFMRDGNQASVRVLDAGCGAGYGAALLANDPNNDVTGLDASAEAVAWAGEHYQASNLRFAQGDVTALRDPDASYDLVTAFEVIEHLQDAEGFLREAQRVLRPSGVLLVSTPNRRFYTTERGFHNPFHTREYDGEEFLALLKEHFPLCQVLEQNHAPAISIAPHGGTGYLNGFAAPGAGTADDEPHFFLAVCSSQEAYHARPFAYLPESGNVLREREQHIHKLEQGLASFQEETRRELAERREWAEKLEAELRDKGAVILQLQTELQERLGWADRLNVELREKSDYIVQLQCESEERIGELGDRLAERQKEVECLEAEVRERAAWAAALNQEIETARARLLEAQRDLRRREEARAAQVASLQRELESREQARAEQVGALEQEMERREQVRVEQVAGLQSEIALELERREQARLQQVAGLEQEMERRERARLQQVAGLEQEMERREQVRAAQVAGLEQEMERREQARLQQVADLERELQIRADWAHGLNDRIAALEAALRDESAELAALRATLWHRAGHTLRFTPRKDQP
jgi:SAM-dependent methyltransferase